jgi:O-antigen biosynthesis protein
MLIRWIKSKNRERLAARRASRLHKLEPMCAHIDFHEVVDPQTLVFDVPDKPLVSVIVPGYGKSAYTLRCLKSLLTAQNNTSFEVIVVEDASGDPSAELLRQVRGITLLWNEENLGFLRSCNRAAQHARGRHLYLLNNDTVLLDRAIDALVDTLEEMPEAGIVGSKLIYPDGRLQEAGGIVWDNGDAANYGRLQDPRDPKFCYRRHVDYVSGASIMLSRQLWQDVGGFDERFAPAYYEDTDLSIRLQKLGHPTVFEPRSVVVHCEGVSNGTSLNEGVKAYQVVNREKFLAAHEDFLRKTRLPSGDLSYRCADRLHQRTGAVLVIDHYLPECDRDAGSRNMFDFIRTLLDLGYAVKFWPQNLQAAPKYTEPLEALGIEVLRFPFQRSFDEWIATNGVYFTHVLLSRPTVAPDYLDAVRRHTQSTVVYYGHDLHFARMLMQAEVQKDAVVAQDAQRMRTCEIGIWNRCDLVVYPSQEEVDEVRRLAPGANAAFIPPFKFSHFFNRTEAQPGQKVLFVAGFQHAPNVDAAQWLAQDVMPLVWQTHPMAELYLVGSKPTSSVLALHDGRRVHVTGEVSAEGLQEHFQSARVSVVPLRFGAGVKLKVVETMQQGVPLVTTTVGLQGLPEIEQVITPCDQVLPMADRIKALLSDDHAWVVASQEQSAYVVKHFSESCMRQRFQQLLAPDQTRKIA